MVATEILTSSEKELLFALLDTNVPEALRKKLYFNHRLSEVDMIFTAEIIEEFILSREEMWGGSDSLIDDRVYNDANNAMLKFFELADT